MGRAEDSIRARERQEEARRREEEASERAKATALVPKVLEEIPRALARLASKGYPGAQMGTKSGFLGIKSQKACWSIKVGTAYIIDSDVDQHVALYSDGSLSHKPQQMSADHLSSLLVGLQCLGK